MRRATARSRRRGTPAVPDAAEPGEIAHVDGRVLGRHAGVARYTVGQGRGLGAASRDERGEPLYVAALDAAASAAAVAAPATQTNGG